MPACPVFAGMITFAVWLIKPGHLQNLDYSTGQLIAVKAIAAFEENLGYGLTCILTNFCLLIIRIYYSLLE